MINYARSLRAFFLGRVMASKWVYETLVADDNDVRGFIAYAFYKRSKHQRALDARQEGKSEPEVQAIIKGHHDHVVASPLLLSGFEAKAETFLNNIADSIYNEAKREVVSQNAASMLKLKGEHDAAVKVLQARFDSQAKQLATAQSNLLRETERLKAAHSSEIAQLTAEHEKTQKKAVADAMKKLKELAKTHTPDHWFKSSALWVWNGFSGIVAAFVTALVVGGVVYMSSPSIKQAESKREFIEAVLNVFLPEDTSKTAKENQTSGNESRTR
jgi:cell division septum initiation protein DivIVA